MRFLQRFLADRAGTTGIEYGLIAVGVSCAILVAVQTIGPVLKNKLAAAQDALDPEYTSSIRVRAQQK